MYIDADVRDTNTILEEAARTLDLSRPVGLTTLGIMGQLTDDQDGSDEPESHAVCGVGRKA